MNEDVILENLNNYYAISGNSMYPTITLKDMVEIDYNLSSIKRGDVIIFKCDGKLILHRITAIVNNKIKTRGDNNKKDDTKLITRSDILGKAIWAWQRNKKRKIYNGFLGICYSKYVRIYNKIYRFIDPLIIYSFAKIINKDSSIKKILKFRTVKFNIGNKEIIRHMIGSRIIIFDHFNQTNSEKDIKI